jgi:hypothetical protein
MELEECLRTATKLWQEYNELFFGFHLDFLRKRMAPVGLILVVFDTRKIYDDPERASFPAFRNFRLSKFWQRSSFEFFVMRRFPGGTIRKGLT